MNVRQKAREMIARIKGLIDLESSRAGLCLSELDPADYDEDERFIIAMLVRSHAAIELLATTYDEFVEYLGKFDNESASDLQ